jgi:hypothetical protein
MMSQTDEGPSTRNAFAPSRGLCSVRYYAVPGDDYGTWRDCVETFQTERSHLFEPRFEAGGRLTAPEQAEYAETPA